MDPLMVLTYIAIIFMSGVLCAFISRELKLPYNLILILLGLFLGSLVYGGVPLLWIDNNFILGIGLLVLIMMVFDSASRVRISGSSIDSVPAMRFINNFTLLSVVVVTFFVAYGFYPSPSIEAILYSIIFSVLVVETDLGSVLVLFRDFATRRAKHLLLFLETEANMNTAFVVLLPFILLSLLGNVDYESQGLLAALFTNLPEFLYEILIAIGIGIIVGLIMLRLLKGWYEKNFSPIVLVASCLVAYTMTGLMGGNGIIAVAIMGFFYGSSYVEGKEQLNEFSRMLHSALEILVFVMLGMVVRPPISAGYVASSFVLFAVIICVRVISAFLALQNEPFTRNEKLFIGLNMPKGIALASVLLVLSTFGVPELDFIVQLGFMIMLYSIAMSFLLDFYAESMLVEKVRVSSSNGINVLELNLPGASDLMVSQAASRARNIRRANVKKSRTKILKKQKQLKKQIVKKKTKTSIKRKLLRNNKKTRKKKR